jgi:hypothetical protein
MNTEIETMNFANHSKAGSLDSGDALTCISTGVTVARQLLKALAADLSMSSTSKVAFGHPAEQLRAWMIAARQLLSSTDDQTIDTLDIETYIRAAEQHGQDDDPDHEVGDLQDHLREMWKLLTPDQQAAFAESPEVRERVELGIGSDEDEDDDA